METSPAAPAISEEDIVLAALGISATQNADVQDAVDAQSAPTTAPSAPSVDPDVEAAFDEVCGKRALSDAPVDSEPAAKRVRVDVASEEAHGSTEADVDDFERDGCDPVGKYRWFCLGWVAEVHLDCRTKKVTWVDGTCASPPNGEWTFDRNSDGTGRFVVAFHHKGDLALQKTHVLYQDVKDRPHYRTRFGEAGGAGSNRHVAMWPVE